MHSFWARHFAIKLVHVECEPVWPSGKALGW